MTPSDRIDLVATGEAAHLLGLSIAGLRHLVSDGVLVPEYRLSNRRLLFARDTVLGLKIARAAEKSMAAEARVS